MTAGRDPATDDAAALAAVNEAQSTAPITPGPLVEPEELSDGAVTFGLALLGAVLGALALIVTPFLRGWL